MNGPAIIRVLIADDHPVLRLGLRLVLEDAGFQVCDEVDSIQAARQAIARCPPDLAVVDLALGSDNGVELIGLLAREQPALPVLVYSAFGDASHMEQALRAGARAYVVKGEPCALIGEAVRECLAGRRFLSPKTARMLNEAPHVGTLLESLSSQELQVYRYLGQGVSPAEIASRMDLSPRTVESYFARIQIKLGVLGMKELRARAAANPV